MSFYLDNYATAAGFIVYDKVTFITSTNMIEVQITNLTNSIRGDVQAISSIDFLVNGMSGLPTGSSLALKTTGDANLGNTLTITGTGLTGYTGIAPVLNSGLTAAAVGWQIASSSLLSSGLKLSTFPATPEYLIAGAPNYLTANGSLTGASHNPFFETDGNSHISFIVNFAPSAGVTDQTTISTTTMPKLNFGTTDAGLEVLMTDQPEPATVGMMLGGLGLIVLGSIRRRKQAAPAQSSEPQR